MCDHPHGIQPEICAECGGDGVHYQLDGQFDCVCPSCHGAGFFWWCPDCQNLMDPGTASIEEWFDAMLPREDDDPSLPWVGLDIG